MQKSLLGLIGAILLQSALAFAANENQVRALHSGSAGVPATQRMELFSHLFMGDLYLDGPLGEGPGAKYDQDPLYRFDRFDCTTFVETVLSLAQSQDWSGFENQMRLIRYDRGMIDFTTRNHFTDLDWTPNNVRDHGWRDITERVAPGMIYTAEALIDKPGWYAKLPIERVQVPGATPDARAALLMQLRAEGARFRAEIARVPYISIDELFNLSERDRAGLLERIPHGAIINIVRPDWDLVAAAGTRMNISHQGLLFRERTTGVVMMHHATPTTRRVAGTALVDYLHPFIGHATVKGFNLVQAN